MSDALDFLTLEELCSACALERDWLVVRVREGLIVAEGGSDNEWRFTTTTLARVRTCARSNAPTTPRPNSPRWWRTCWRKWTLFARGCGAPEWNKHPSRVYTGGTDSARRPEISFPGPLNRRQ